MNFLEIPGPPEKRARVLPPPESLALRPFRDQAWGPP